ncbi:MAG TPA: hypothetical protein VNO31_43585 [Umezawaea sp.]|nr:hypothetical protein [Umezawaea sp.]
MNLTDLTEVLRDHADVPGAPPDARLAGVRAKVTTTRRRRAVAGAACVVLAFLGVVYAVAPQHGRLSEPALPVRSFPEYQGGTKLVAQAWAELPSTSATVTFVPKSLDLRVASLCDIGYNRSLLVHITVNGKTLVAGGCDGAVTSAGWAGLGVVVGQPSVVTLTVDGEQDHSVTTGAPTLAPPPDGVFGIAVGEAVPVDEYPLPPRPATLEPLTTSLGDPETAVSADPGDPTARKEITVIWPGDRMLLAQVNTPGRLRVLVDDVQVLDYSHWSYEAEGAYSLMSDSWAEEHGIAPVVGAPVRITVIPERVTGDWEVIVTKN